MSQQLTWPKPWARLAEAAGGVDELAKRVASPRRCLVRWALEGVTPAGPAAVLLELVARELGVPSPVTAARLELEAAELLARGARELVKAKRRRADQVAAAHARFAKKHGGRRSSAATTR